MNGWHLWKHFLTRTATKVAQPMGIQEYVKSSPELLQLRVASSPERTKSSGLNWCLYRTVLMCHLSSERLTPTWSLTTTFNTVCILGTQPVVCTGVPHVRFTGYSDGSSSFRVTEIIFKITQSPFATSKTKV